MIWYVMDLNPDQRITSMIECVRLI